MSNSLMKMMRRSSKTPSPGKTDNLPQGPSTGDNENDSAGEPASQAKRRSSSPILANLNPFKTKPPTSKFAQPSKARTVDDGQDTPSESIGLHPLSQAADPAAKPYVQGCEMQGKGKQPQRTERADSHHDNDTVAVRDFALTTSAAAAMPPPARSPAQDLIRPPPQTKANEQKIAEAALKSKNPKSLASHPTLGSSSALPSASAGQSSPPQVGQSIAHSSTERQEDDEEEGFHSPTRQTVTVRPPVFDINRKSGHHWCQAGVTSSRPHAPWEQSPRWQCCTCGSFTIVEQIVCANLECGHGRCPGRCRVNLGSWMKTMFGGVFVGS